jgi:F-type H+-transporting ATPase subunit epsilon
MTLERKFFSGNVEALTVTLPDGLLTVLAGHRIMSAALSVGVLRYKMDGEWRECAATEGFLEVRHDRVIVFVQACEYPEEIDESRARAALERAKERISAANSLREHEITRIALARAMNRLRITDKKRYNL